MSPMKNLTGTAAPDFRAPSSHGQTLERESFLDKVALVLVFPPTDGPDAVLAEFDRRLVDFGHRRVQVLAVLHDTAKEVRSRADSVPLDALTLLADEDGSITEAFGVDERPGYIVVDKDGVVQGTWIGAGEASDVDRVLAACDGLTTDA